MTTTTIVDDYLIDIVTELEAINSIIAEKELKVLQDHQTKLQRVIKDLKSNNGTGLADAKTTLEKMLEVVRLCLAQHNPVQLTFDSGLDVFRGLESRIQNALSIITEYLVMRVVSPPEPPTDPPNQSNSPRPQGAGTNQSGSNNNSRLASRCGTFVMTLLIMLFGALLSELRDHFSQSVIPIPTPVNFPMLPPLGDDSEFVADGLVDGKHSFAFLTPTKGRYYFSIQLDALSFEDIDVRLERINPDGNDLEPQNPKNSQPTQSGSWEFYPLEGGEYNIIIQRNDNNIAPRFTIRSYTFRNLTCVLRYIDPVGGRVSRSPGESGIGTTAAFPITNGVFVFAVRRSFHLGTNAYWYQIYYPEGNQFNPDDDETLAWVRESSLDLSSPENEDCKYLDMPFP
jgi:hypothetical protein